MPKTLHSIKLVAIGIASAFALEAQSMDFGLCITPVGVWGVVPCDMSCVGSSFIEGSTTATSSYAEYMASFVEMSAKATQCTTSVLSGFANYDSAVASASSALTTLIQTNTTRLSRDISAASTTFDGNMKLKNKLQQDLMLSLQNHISTTVKDTLKVFYQADGIDHKQSDAVTKIMVTNIEEQRSRFQNEAELRERAAEIQAYDQTSAEMSKQSKVLEKISDSKNLDNRLKLVWDQNQTIFDITPSPLAEIPMILPNKIELLASNLALQNSSNTDYFRSLKRELYEDRN